MQVLEYHCGHLPSVVAELDAIRTGTGHADTADDLMRLAHLYRTHSAELRHDTRHYLPDDEARARANAEEITRLLRANETSIEARWRGRVARAWTLLWSTYEEHVRPAGRFLFRLEPDVADRFPTLNVALRTSRERGEHGDSASSSGNGNGSNNGSGDSGDDAPRGA
jgi:hypothetical protein